MILRAEGKGWGEGGEEGASCKGRGLFSGMSCTLWSCIAPESEKSSHRRRIIDYGVLLRGKSQTKRSKRRFRDS